MDVKELIRKIENEFDDIPRGSLGPNSDFKVIINWNSINSVVLSTMIEFDYGVTVSAEEYKTISTVDNLAELIESKKGK